MNHHTNPNPPIYHNTNDQPTVIITTVGIVHIFGWVNFLTDEDADQYLADELNVCAACDELGED